MTTDPQASLLPRQIRNWRAYGQVILVVVFCTGLARLMFEAFAPVNLIMVYLAGVVISAARFGRGPSILAAVLSVGAFDFFFVPPFLTFVVADTQYILTLAMMLMIALVVSNLTARIREQAETARERERRTASLYALSREFANSHSPEELVQVATRHISGLFHTQAVFLFPEKGQLQFMPNLDDKERQVAQWVFEHGRRTGPGAERFGAARGMYIPLLTARGTIGVLAVYPAPGQLLSADQRNLLEAFANQTALALERSRLAEETEQVRLQMETERLRNSLLSSVSHDLRTPLAVITGSVSSLLDSAESLDTPDRRELLQVAYEEADRLNRLVGNLLTMTRLESGGIHVQKEWQPLEEVIGTTLERLKGRLVGHPMTTHLPPDLPPVPIDDILIEQVLINLLENAVKYTPLGSPIELSAYAGNAEVIVQIADRGPGLTPGEESRIFDKFYRARPSISGVGLGLTICRGIVEAHHGRIWAENRPDGGALFSFALPLEGELPKVEEQR